MASYGFEMDSKGKTSGSRVRFYRPSDGRMFVMHAPHPSDELTAGTIRNIVAFCKMSEVVMSNVLAYKGYFAPVEFDAEQHVLTGMVAGIRDAIVFEGSTAEEVEQCFHDAVDDYLEFCAEKGKEPERAFKGSFNVRTGSELHKQAALAAAKKGESLNKFVTEAIAAAL